MQSYSASLIIEKCDSFACLCCLFHTGFQGYCNSRSYFAHSIQLILQLLPSEHAARVKQVRALGTYQGPGRNLARDLLGTSGDRPWQPVQLPWQFSRTQQAFPAHHLSAVHQAAAQNACRSTDWDHMGPCTRKSKQKKRQRCTATGECGIGFYVVVCNCALTSIATGDDVSPSLALLLV